MKIVIDRPWKSQSNVLSWFVNGGGLWFVLGYALASLRLGAPVGGRVSPLGGSTAASWWVQSVWDVSFNGPACCNVTCLETNTEMVNHDHSNQSADGHSYNYWKNRDERSRRRRNPHATNQEWHDHDYHDVLFDYVYELIESTVGGLEPSSRTSSMLNNVTTRHAALKELFRAQLVKSLIIPGAEEQRPCNCEVERRETEDGTAGGQQEQQPSAGATEPFENQETELATRVAPPQRRIHDSLNHFSGIGRVDRKDFNSIIDSGAPLFLNNPTPGNDVMVLYGPPRTLPDDLEASYSSINAGADNSIPAKDAIKNCRQLSVIHLRNDGRGHCWALVPGQESFHIQKWLRVGPDRNTKLNKTMPLRLVARGYDPGSGGQHPGMPSTMQAKIHRLWLGEYMQHADELVAEILPILERIAVNKKVVFTVVNAGQATLLLNFACAAKSRGLDISKVLVFVLDKESRNLVEGLGMAAYYNEKFFGVLPSTDGNYGDTNFSMVVLAKIMGAHLLSLSGYDFLAQDVDVFWYKDPLTFFEDPTLADPEFDIYFQDDINPGIRFQPWRANSGFYFARSNDRTRMLMKDFVTKTDQLMSNRCDQQTLAEVMAEQVSLWGLRVKVFDADDTNYFPCGGHYQWKRSFMEKLVNGELDDEVYVFHMNWNPNKKDKIAYMKQMGYWFVHDQCMGESHNTLFQILRGNSTISDSCCSTEALFSCQFRDKPSIKPCKESPPHDYDDPSWW